MAKGFEPKINREGFIANVYFAELVAFVRFAIDWSTILRDYSLREEALKIAILSKEKFEETIGEKVSQSRVVETAISHLKTEANIASDYLPPLQKKQFESIFERATEVIQKQYNATQVELSHLRMVASASSLLLIFSHEVKSLLGVLEQSKNSLSNIAKNLGKAQSDKLSEIGDNFGELKDRLSELLSLTSLVGIDNRGKKPGQIALLERVKKIEKVFELIIGKYGISIDYSGVPNNFVLKEILESEVYSILLNVFSNSIKAVIAGGKKRIIKIEAKRTTETGIITILDTGVGLEKSRYEEVFIPFISDPDGSLYEKLSKKLNPEDNLIVGSGSGLGLGIAREIVSAHSGTIRFKAPREGWSTELEIKLP